MSLGSKQSSVRIKNYSIKTRSRNTSVQYVDAAEKIIEKFSRANRRLEFPSPDAVLILAKIEQMTSRNMLVSRGAVVDVFTGSDGQNILPTSTVFSSIASCARVGLIETVVNNQTNKISGRPVQSVKATKHGRMLLQKVAEITEILEGALISHKSNATLN